MAVHPFEKAGLGKAPFKYVGQVHQDISYGMANIQIQGPNGPICCQTKPGGTCDFCGTYIVDMFRIKSADDKTFIVGSDCLLKTWRDREPGTTPIEGEAKAARDIRESKTKKRHAAEDRRTAKAKADLEAHAAIQADWAKLPHPFKHRAEKGETFLDYVTFLFEHAGRSGKLDAAKLIERELAARSKTEAVA